MPSQSPLKLNARYLAVAGAVLVVSAAAYLVLRRPLAEAIYFGDVPGLGGLLQGQATQGVDFYLHVIDKLALMGFAVALLAAILVGVATDRIRFGTESAELLVIAGTIATVVFAISSYSAIREPINYAGDASEYYQMTQSFIDHGTPDLRHDDVVKFETERLSDDIIGNPPMSGYLKSPVNGKWYSVHFWGYSLISIPLRLLLTLFGLPGMKAFELLNLLAFFGSVAAMLLLAEMHPLKRAVFASVLALSPIIWYVPWSSLEAFTAALVVFSIVFFSRKQYALATLFAAVASTQNQPLLLVAAAYVVYAAIQWLPQRRYSEMVRMALAGAVALVPMVFYFATFRLLSPLWAGFGGWGNVSAARFIGFFFDLDMGLLPYLPLVTIGFVVAVAVVVIRRDRWAIARALVIAGMVILAATTARGWTSASVGLMRYGVWVLPVILWVVVDSLGAKRRDAIMAAALISVQLAAILVSSTVSLPNANGHGLFGRLALAKAPWLYSPPAEQFVARTTGKYVSASEFQPVAFANRGMVTKVLADKAHLARLADYYDISPAAIAALEPHQSDADGMYYVNVRPGRATMRTQETTLQALAYPMTAEVGGPTSLGPSDEKAASDRFNIFPVNSDGGTIVSPLASYPLFVTVRNSSEETWYPAGSRPLGMTARVLDESGQPARGSETLNYPLIQAVFPGEMALMYPTFITPSEEGVYRLVVTFVQKDESGNPVPLAAKIEVPITVHIAPPAVE